MKNLLYYLLLVVIIGSCSQNADKTNTTDATEEVVKELPEDFVSFYSQFLSDSLFQIDHILFPLEGIPDNAQSVDADGSFRWQLDNWKMHKPIPESISEFRTEFNVLGPGIILERVVHQTDQYAMLRRFAKLGGEWTLIYYAGLNSISTETEE